MVDKMDRRVRDRLVRKGVVEQTAVDKYLDALPDAETNAEWVDYEGRFEEERAEQGAEEAEAKQEEVVPPPPAAPQAGVHRDPPIPAPAPQAGGFDPNR